MELKMKKMGGKMIPRNCIDLEDDSLFSYLSVPSDRQNDKFQVVQVPKKQQWASPKTNAWCFIFDENSFTKNLALEIEG